MTVGRRAILGSAWAVPMVVLATAVPARAASETPFVFGILNREAGEFGHWDVSGFISIIPAAARSVRVDIEADAQILTSVIVATTSDGSANIGAPFFAEGMIPVRARVIDVTDPLNEFEYGTVPIFPE